ncbi:MAG: terminase small subunit [Ruminococcaceae bacterium]|nr:terminase small subunit [Oscillospiraceae bacterium]
MGRDGVTRMLTTRQKVFADAVLGGKEPSEAYRLAGYREANAVAAARRLLKAPTVQAYMEHIGERHADQSVASSQEILQFLTAVLRGEVGSEKERMRAAELLGKRQGLFSDKAMPEAVTEVVIVDDLGG